MKWRPMHTAPRYKKWVLVTLESVYGDRRVAIERMPYSRNAVAWHPIEPYAGVLEELNAEGGDA